MPNTNEIVSSRKQVKEWAIDALMLEGTPKDVAIKLVEGMDYEQRIQWAEKVNGPIYRGAYSPF